MPGFRCPLLSVIAVLAHAVPATAQPQQPPAMVYTGPASTDVARAARDRLARFAQQRGLGLSDLATAAAPKPRAKALLKSGIEAYHAFKYADALVALEACVAEVEASGGEGLLRRELADLFLYRALSATETGALETARANLVRAATIHPSYPIDKARFRPSLVASWERARSAVLAVAGAEVTLKLGADCLVYIDGGLTSPNGTLSLRPGRHLARATCPNTIPFAGTWTFSAGAQSFQPAMRPRKSDRDRALEATAPAAQVLWIALRKQTASISLIDRVSDKSKRRWTVQLPTTASASKLDAVLASILEQEFAGPIQTKTVYVDRPRPRRRWYVPVLWAALGAVAVAAVAVPAIVLRGSSEPTGFDVDLGELGSEE